VAGGSPSQLVADNIGFDTRGSARFDRHTRILVGREVCAIATLVTADKPLPLKEQRRYAREARDALKGEGDPKN
jgi:hypothetical protein